MDAEAKLYAAFETLAAAPGIGHLRQDLISSNVHFYYVEPYLVVYRRETNPLIILTVVHGSRDIAALLQERF